ncbi:unnamed protein product, partial [Tetraodon nigroviridis]
MQRPVSSLSLSPSVKVKLVGAGFQFTSDLLHVDAQQLSKEAGLTQPEAQEVLQGVRRAEEGGAPCSCTALELLQKEEEELRTIVTFSSQLDAALGGGAPVGRMTEVCGVPGVGKTQLCLQLAVDVQVPHCFGGLGAQVVYVDTEGGFRLQRLLDLAAAAVNHCSLLAEDQEQRVAMETFTVETILSNVFVVRCHDYLELLAELHLMPGFLSAHPGVRLLVVDSVASPFRPLLDELSQRTRLLSGLAQQLVAMAASRDMAVVVTNQMTTRVWGTHSEVVPALGDTWGHAAAIRLRLQWEGPRRLATIVKSPCHRVSAVGYQITSEGFRDA